MHPESDWVKLRRPWATRHALESVTSGKKDSNTEARAMVRTTMEASQGKSKHITSKDEHNDVARYAGEASTSTGRSKEAAGSARSGKGVFFCV